MRSNNWQIGPAIANKHDGLTALDREFARLQLIMIAGRTFPQRWHMDTPDMQTLKRELRPCTHKIRLNVRFALKATEMVRRREMTLWAQSATKRIAAKACSSLTQIGNRRRRSEPVRLPRPAPPRYRAPSRPRPCSSWTALDA
jgi:hypothetical protein